VCFLALVEFDSRNSSSGAWKDIRNSPGLPNRLAQDESEQFALLGRRLSHEQIGSSAR